MGYLKCLNRLAIYQKIGDIAMQIEAIENNITKFHNNMDFSCNDNEMLIIFHWDRLHLLESMLHTPIKDIMHYIEQLNLCSQCLQDIPCEIEFTKYCQRNLILSMLTWKS